MNERLQIADADFHARLKELRDSKPIDFFRCLREILSFRLTEYQLTVWCHVRLSLLSPSSYTAYLRMTLNTQYMTSEHIDIWLRDLDLYGIQCLLGRCSTLTPEQINFCLNHESVIVRLAAYDHKCCTEEQKVCYHLKFGYAEMRNGR